MNASIWILKSSSRNAGLAKRRYRTRLLDLSREVPEAALACSKFSLLVFGGQPYQHHLLIHKLTLEPPSLAWAEMYIVIAKLIQHVDLQLQGAGPKDVECVSDQFIIGTADPSGIKAIVTKHEG